MNPFPDSESADRPERLNGPRLLVLDDHESMFRFCETAFREYFEVTWSPRKEPFLDAIGVHLELAPDIVITDIMSSSMNGLEFLEQLKVRGLSHLFPVIVMSGYGGCRKEALGRGASMFLSKSCGLNELRGCVRRVYFMERGVFFPLDGGSRPLKQPDRLRLMILDDCRNQVYSYLMLFHWNFEVTWSSRKDTFLEQISRNPRSAPDVVISDLNSWPMNGIRFLTQRKDLWG